MRPFPTIEELRSLPLSVLKGSLTDSVNGVTSPEEERLLQEVINEKTLGTFNVNIDFRMGIGTDSVGHDSIQTPEDEARAQAIIDERIAKFQERMRIQAMQIPQAQIVGPEEPEVPAPVTEVPQVQEVPETVPVQPQPEARFCQFCTSKGKRHLKLCTRVV